MLRGSLALILILLVVLADCLITAPSVHALSEPLIPSSKTIVRKKRLSEQQFNSERSAWYNLTCTFYPNGTSAFMLDGTNEMLTWNHVVSGLSISLLYNSTHVAYHVQKSGYDILIYFNFGLPNKLKITIQGYVPIAVSLQIRFVVRNLYRYKADYTVWSVTKLKVGSLETFRGLGFSWADAKNSCSFNNITRTLTFVLNEAFNIDPSLIGIGTTVSVWYPYQRKSFGTATRHFAFYYDGSGIVFRSSLDGVTWSSATFVCIGNDFQFSAWYDGSTYCYYTRVYLGGVFPTYYGLLYFRRGIPNSDGTITWSTERVVQNSTAYEFDYPFVSADSSGYPWISYIRYTVATDTSYPFARKCNQNDGTWSSDTIYQLSTTIAVWDGTSIVPIPNQNMIVVYAVSGYSVRIKGWDNAASAFKTERATTNAIFFGVYHSITAIGNIGYLTFMGKIPYNLYYRRYNFTAGSLIDASDTTVQASTTSTSAPIISHDIGTSDIYIFWAKSNGVNYKIWFNGNASLSSVKTWFNETLYDNDRISCFYKSYQYRIGLMFLNSTAGVRYVRYAFLRLFYYMDFNHQDLDLNTVDSKVTWGLYNSTQLLSYTESQTTLRSGTYTLKTYRNQKLINQTNLITDQYGNKTTNLKMGMKAHTSVSNGYVTFNVSIVTITINSQTATNLTFTATSALTRLIIDVPNNATYVKKNHVTQTGWYYNSSGGYKYISINTTALSSTIWELSFAPSKTWHTIATWSFTLNTRSWHTITTWAFTLTALMWHTISTWSFILSARIWNTVSTWAFNFSTRVWTEISSWLFTLQTMTWNTIATWTFQFGTQVWHIIANWAFALVTVGWHTISTWDFTLRPLEVPFPFIYILTGILLLGLTGLVMTNFKSESDEKDSS